MMIDVLHPEQAATVRAAVIPVIGKVVGEEQQHPGPPDEGREREQAMFIDESKQPAGIACAQGQHAELDQAQRDADAAVLDLVAPFALALGAAQGEPLPGHQDQKIGHGDVEDVFGPPVQRFHKLLDSHDVLTVSILSIVYHLPLDPARQSV